MPATNSKVKKLLYPQTPPTAAGDAMILGRCCPIAVIMTRIRFSSRTSSPKLKQRRLGQAGAGWGRLGQAGAGSCDECKQLIHGDGIHGPGLAGQHHMDDDSDSRQTIEACCRGCLQPIDHS